jgi:N utilization substance protein B
MKRRRAREYALQFLFQSDFSSKDQAGENLKQFLAENEKEPEVTAFALKIFQGTLSILNEIDSIIEKAAENWVLKRIAAVDRNILRFAVYEFLRCDDIPAAVTINEAIEIAKKYSTIESSAFINGILDDIAKKTTTGQKAK